MAPHSPEGISSAPQTPERSPVPADLPEVTTTAMDRFACLAERCEDTCCRDWAVPIDRADLDRMKATMSTTADGRERLLRLVVIGNPARASGGLGQLQMDDQCACPMLETDNRCGVHATFGEEALTTSCAVFPRTALATPTALEVGGSLGCPEVARLTLLSDQADLRLRPASRPMLPRPYVGKTVGGDPQNAQTSPKNHDPDDAYARYFDDVREGLLDCFRRDHLPLGTQLVVAADYAERAHAFLYRGTSEFLGARRSFAEHRLHAEIAHTRSPELHAALDRDLAALTASGQPVMSFVWSLLSERRRLPHAPRFATLLGQVFTSLRQEAGAGDSAALDTETSGDGLWPVYATRRVAFAARWGQRFDSLFSKYCQHYLLRNPYTDAATLLDHVYNLGIHLAAVRMLTVGHPELAARLAADPEPEADARLLDQVVVHVVQTFTKAVSHHPSFLNAAGLGSERKPVPMTFGRLVLLAKFV
ncbi:MAG: flagellin lysine-N-methylase [Polyangia bacterium]